MGDPLEQVGREVKVCGGSGGTESGEMSLKGHADAIKCSGHPHKWHAPHPGRDTVSRVAWPCFSSPVSRLLTACLLCPSTVFPLTFPSRGCMVHHSWHLALVSPTTTPAPPTTSILSFGAGTSLLYHHSSTSDMVPEHRLRATVKAHEVKERDLEWRSIACPSSCTLFIGMEVREGTKILQVPAMRTK